MHATQTVCSRLHRFYVPSCVVKRAKLIPCMTDNMTATSFSGITPSKPAASSILTSGFYVSPVQVIPCHSCSSLQCVVSESTSVYIRSAQCPRDCYNRAAVKQLTRQRPCRTMYADHLTHFAVTCVCVCVLPGDQPHVQGDLQLWGDSFGAGQPAHR